MIKKKFICFFSVFLIFIFCFGTISVSAYEPTGFDVSAKAALLVSLDTGDVLYSLNPDEKVYPASIAKIMTATVMLESEKYEPEAKIAMTEEVKMILGTGSVVSNLKAGEEIKQIDLLHYILISSAGDCAYLAAMYYGGSLEGFVEQMNRRAAELGLTGTHYGNPIGLHDEDTYTTVNDIYTLTAYALKNADFKAAVETLRYTVAATNFSPARTLSTTNYLQDQNTNYYYPYAHGVKTGYTDEAGRCLVSTASYNGYRYLCIVMGCPPNERRHFTDSANLYRWAFNNFSSRQIASSKEPVCETKVNLSFDTDHVALYFEKPFVAVLPNEADDSTLVIKEHLKAESVNAPVHKGDVLGTADVIYAEKVIGTVNLVAGTDIAGSRLLTITDKITSFFKTVFSPLVLKIVLIAAAAAVLLFILGCVLLNYKRIKRRRVKYKPYKNGRK